MLMALNLTSDRSIRSRTVEASFVCKFCHKSLTTEARYLAHKCKEMKRFEEAQTPLGQAALNYYQRWMRVMKRNPPPAAAFLTSKYFRTFNNFAQFVIDVSLPLPDTFIWLMNEKKFPPTMWTHNEAYTLYMEFLDHKADPMDQAKQSIKTLLSLADKANVSIDDVFNHIHPSDLIQLIRLRQLSPWLLMHSTKFKLFFKHKLSAEQKIILGTLINPDYWSTKFEDNPDEVEQIKLFVQEMNI